MAAEKGVCLKKKASPAIPLATLQPGLKFITPFGVVEVVSDDRAVPLAPDANDGDKDQSGGTDDMVTGDEKNDGKTAERSGKKRKKSSAPSASTAYRKAVATRNAQAGRLRSTVTVMSMARRKELTRAYQEGKIDQQSVWAVQYGRDPRRIPSWQHARFPEVKPVVKEDPSAPSSSFPDRIVVCRWVKDERDRFLGIDKELPTLDSPPRRPDDRPTLFLQRRMLTSPLGEGAASYMCPTCGQSFLSKAGALYHQERSKCTEGRNSSDQSTNLIKSWDSKAINILRRKDLRQAESQPVLAATMSDVGSDLKVSPIPVPPPTPRPTGKPSSMTEAVNIKEEPAIPEVKVLAKTRKEKKLELSAKPDFVDPRKVLADLEMELRLQQSIMIGPVYPSVYKVLQFQKPGSKKKRQRRTKQEIEREEEREAIAKAIQKEKEAIARLAKLRSRILLPEQKTTTLVTVAVENAPEPALPLQRAPGKGGLKVAVTNAENEPNEISGRDANQTNPVVRPDASQTTPLRPINEKPEVHARDTPESSAPVPEQEELTDLTILNSPEIPGLKQSDLQKEEGLKVNQPEQETKGSMTTQLAVKKPDFEYGSFLCSLPDRPPMIDTRVLVQEIDAGRYPSINRRAAQKPDKGQYAGKCTICRTAEPVLQKCNFCPRSVHMACARLKYTLPDPEPYDDFLCNVCIQAITHRRNRAERRRIERMMGVEVAATTPSVTEMKHPQIPLHRDAPRQLEYEAVVSQGRHMSNLVDLEADARMRLQREMEHSKLNEIRRQMMML